LIEDINEPVDLFRTEFKDAHARHTAELFETLLAQSGVDAATNAETVRILRSLESQIESASETSGWWKFAQIAALGIGACCLVVALSQSQYWWLVGVAAAGALIVLKLNPIIATLAARLDDLKQQRDAQLRQAWQEMAPLNRLYRWDMVADLMQKTVPRIALDPYFSTGRLDELRTNFGWTDEFNVGRSVLFAHSGVLNGNPFVVARTLNHWIGSKTYHGSLQISWRERVRDSQGKWTTHTRHQTLHASVTKPFPEYSDQPIIIYGNEAAPDLSFSRSPSDLSGLDDGLINNWRKRRAVKALEAKSRELHDGHGFMVMSNAEFDALFAATDRDHEIQFRLLFTPLAQQEMLRILRDKDVGFGDRFRFFKQRMINLVEPSHMVGTDISGDPEIFRHYELAAARQQFNAYHAALFRSLYFGLAPILAIPLYQQHRSHADIYKDVYTRRSNFWEHESIANYLGEHHFQHPACVTRNILKTEAVIHDDGAQTVHVSAHGYAGTDRVDFVSVLGGDHRHHNVPVHWVEYRPVHRDSQLAVHELMPDDTASAADEAAKPAWVSAFESRGLDAQKVVVRRSVATTLLAS